MRRLFSVTLLQRFRRLPEGSLVLCVARTFLPPLTKSVGDELLAPDMAQSSV